ncbi:MAG: hypothetical protein GY804_04085 [Alphaproteobacteria bacterium]|nr:hypothetical protein [Alphaproteobacteria bacterium]
MDFKKYSPTTGDVHVNRPLSNVSVAYMQSAENFIADKVFPNIPVSKKSDLYFEYDPADFNRSGMKERAPGTESQGVTHKLSTNPYYCRTYAEHEDVHDEVRANSDDGVDVDVDATNLISGHALIHKEMLWASNFFGSGIWGTDDSTALWGGTGTLTDPIADIRSAKRSVQLATTFMPNTLVLGANIWDALADNADVLERVLGGATNSQPGTGTLKAMQDLFEIPNIHVMQAVKNSANEGQTASNAFVGGDLALLCYVAPAPGKKVPSAGYTFSWNGMMGSSALGGRISRFRMEHLKSERVEIEMSFAQKLIGSKLGYMFTNPLG